MRASKYKSLSRLFIIVSAFSIANCREDEARLPEVVALSISNVSTSMAQVIAIVTSDGGAPVSGRGVCVSVETDPTTESGISTVEGEGTGSYTSEIENLQPGTTYHVRAYAMNEVGTNYSNELTFKTLNATPVLNTTEASMRPIRVTRRGL